MRQTQGVMEADVWKHLLVFVYLLDIGTAITTTASTTNNNIKNELTTSRTSSPWVSRNANSRNFMKTALCPENWTLATSSHMEFGQGPTMFCIKVDKRKASWSSSVEKCRKKNGFMLKLDGILDTEQGTLFDQLTKTGIEKIWTGIHEQHGTFVWDGIRPDTVRPYYGPSEQFGWRTRGWGFDESSFLSNGKTCGALYVGNYDSQEPSPLEQRWQNLHGNTPSRYKHRERRNSLHNGAEPSAATPLLTPLRIDPEDLLINKHPTEETKIEQLTRFLANTGFQLAPSDMLSRNGFLSKSHRIRRYLTNSKVTTTTDHSNHDDDDYPNHDIKVPPDPDIAGFRLAINDELTKTTIASPPRVTTRSPLLQFEKPPMVIASPPDSSTSSSMIKTDSLHLQDTLKSSNIDEILNLLLQTAMEEHSANDTNIFSASNDGVLVVPNSTPSSTNASETQHSNISGGPSSNSHLRQLIRQATMTSSPIQTASSKEDQALDILSHLLASAMDFRVSGSNISMKTSTSNPRSSKQMNTLIPSNLNPSNFMMDPAISEKYASNSDQSSSSSVSSIETKSTKINSKSSELNIRGGPWADLLEKSTLQPSLQAEKRKGKKVSIRQELKQKIKESTTSFFDQLFNNINFMDGRTTAAPPTLQTTYTTSTSSLLPSSLDVSPSIPPRPIFSTRMHRDDLLLNGGNQLLSKYSSSAARDNGDSKYTNTDKVSILSGAGQENSDDILVSDSIPSAGDQSISVSDDVMISTLSPVLSSSTTMTSTTESGGNSGEDESSLLSGDSLFISTTTTMPTTSPLETGGGGGGDSGEVEEIISDTPATTTSFITTTTDDNITTAIDGLVDINSVDSSKEINLVDPPNTDMPMPNNQDTSSEVTDSSLIPETTTTVPMDNILLPDPTVSSNVYVPGNTLIKETYTSLNSVGNNDSGESIDPNTTESNKESQTYQDTSILDMNSSKESNSQTVEDKIHPKANNSGEATISSATITDLELNGSDSWENVSLGLESSRNTTTGFDSGEILDANQIKDLEPLISVSSGSSAWTDTVSTSRVNSVSDNPRDLPTSGEQYSVKEQIPSSGEEEGTEGGPGDRDILTPRETMVMENCEEEEMASVCMTEPVQEIKFVGHCERNWLGHRLLDRCYRPLILTVSELEARQRCLRYGATLAMADTDFYGNITVMLLQQGIRKRPGQRTWVDTSLNMRVASDDKCSAIEKGQLIKADCRERLAFICQKDSRNSRRIENSPDRSNPSVTKTPTYIHNTTSFHPQTLTCPLRMSAFDDVIVWYKDGQPIGKEEKSEVTSTFRRRIPAWSFTLSTSDTNISAMVYVLSNHLPLDLSILMRVGPGTVTIPKPAMLQGSYWCEIWRRDPFSREVSPTIHIRFTDVITIHATMQTAPFSDVTAVLANQMGQLTGRAELIGRHLAMMNKNLTHFLREAHSPIRDIITFIKEIKAQDGHVIFYTYICLTSGDISLDQRGHVVHDYTVAIKDALITWEDTVRQGWKVSLPLNDVITVKLPDLCRQTELIDPKSGLSAIFPTTAVNTGALSLDVCDNEDPQTPRICTDRAPEDPLGETACSAFYGVYSGTAWCRGDLQTGAYWDSWHITSSCHEGKPREWTLSSSAAAAVEPSAAASSLEDVMKERKEDEEAEEEESWEGKSSESQSSDDEKSPTRVDGGEMGHDDSISLEDMDDKDKDNDRFFLGKRPNSALLELDEIEVEEENLDDVSRQLAELLEDDDDLSDADIETVADVMDKIAAVNKPSLQISNNLLDTVDRVLDASPEILKKAEMDASATSRLIDDIEDFGVKAKMGSKITSHRHVTPNVAMELWDLDDHSDVVVGLGVNAQGGWKSPLFESRITTIRDRNWMNQHLTDFDIAIELPESLVKNSVRYSDDSLRLSMFVFRKVGLFQSRDPGVKDLRNSVINSGIISASLGGRKVQGLDDHIRLVFKPFQNPQDKESKTRCVFWDTNKVEGQPVWSDKGCMYNGTKDGLEICLCDHLTNFAILLDFYGDSNPIPVDHQTSLSIITLVGISLSMIGLLITIITFLAFKKLRQGRAQQTLFNMAVSLLCFQATFLLGFKQTTIRPLCLAVAMSLHYFILVSFAWMLIEAVLQYLTFVKVLGTYISRYTLKTALPAWLLPLIPVIAVLVTDYKLYLGRNDYCWMDVTAFYYSFAMPVGIIIVFNIVMFFIILASLVTRPQGLRSNQKNNKARETNLKAALTIFILLGLTWLFGYFAVEDARLPFQYMFTVLSSMQGFLIFVLMVLRRKQVRDQWRMLFLRRRNASKPKQKKLSPVSSSSMSSSNCNGLPSFFNQTYTTATSSDYSNNSSSNNSNYYGGNNNSTFVPDSPSDFGTSSSDIYSLAGSFEPVMLPRDGVEV